MQILFANANQSQTVTVVMAAQPRANMQEESLQPSSPFFNKLSKDVRLIIYEFAFSSQPPPETAVQEAWSSLPRSSLHLKPLLTCRHFCAEAKLIAFRCTIHHLNWNKDNPRSQRRLDGLMPDLLASVRHVALTTTVVGFFDKIVPLRFQLNRARPPLICLDTLTITLRVDLVRTAVQEFEFAMHQHDVFRVVYVLKNTKKVVLVNVLHRQHMIDYLPGYCADQHQGLHGQWTSLSTTEADPDKWWWRVEFADFNIHK
jgi:hypothetical protein